MKEWVGWIVDCKLIWGLIVLIFYNFGLNMIREEYIYLGYYFGFLIFDVEDVKVLLQDLMLNEGSIDVGDELNDVQMIILFWKNVLCSFGEVLSKVVDEREQWIVLIYKKYNEYLKVYNVVDFDDLILLFVQLFCSNLDVLVKWCWKICYMLVDEYQDINVCQYELVKLLVVEWVVFIVVGDDDQFIYVWCGV